MIKENTGTLGPFTRHQGRIVSI